MLHLQFVGRKLKKWLKTEGNIIESNSNLEVGT